MRKIIIGIVIIAGLLIIHQLYFYLTWKGNVNIHVCNYSDMEQVELKVELDGRVILDQAVSNENYFVDCKGFSLTTWLGKHHLVVSALDDSVSNEIEFSGFPITWISVEFIQDYYQPNKKYKMLITTQNNPIVLE